MLNVSANWTDCQQVWTSQFRKIDKRRRRLSNAWRHQRKTPTSYIILSGLTARSLPRWWTVSAFLHAAYQLDNCCLLSCIPSWNVSLITRTNHNLKCSSCSHSALTILNFLLLFPSQNTGKLYNVHHIAYDAVLIITVIDYLDVDGRSYLLLVQTSNLVNCVDLNLFMKCTVLKHVNTKICQTQINFLKLEWIRINLWLLVSV